MNRLIPFEVRMWFDNAPDHEISVAWFYALSQWGAELQAMIAHPEFENYEAV
jgi:hypothetical protein